MHVHSLDLLQQVVEHVVVGLDPNPARLDDLLDQSLLAFAWSYAGYMSVRASSASQFR